MLPGAGESGVEVVSMLRMLTLCDLVYAWGGGVVCGHTIWYVFGLFGRKGWEQ